MSKWINKELFEKYQEEKVNEAESKAPGLRRSDYVWPTPAAGTADKPKVYEGRLLQDPKGLFTKKYYYHMFKSGDKMVFYLCPKTDEFGNWCPMCAVTSKLYTGTDADKKIAYNVKRKERHVANFYVVDDPRDKEAESDERKHSGKLKIYEFPGKLESKVKAEVTDRKEGLGHAIFDPGKEGYNLLIKIATTKPDKNGTTYPDYSNSIFSRRASALGSDKEIEEIMKNRYSLQEYLDSLKTSDDDVKKIHKDERFWDLIEDEWNRMKGIKTVDEKTSVDSETDDEKPEDDVPNFESDDDAALLAELDKI